MGNSGSSSRRQHHYNHVGPSAPPPPPQGHITTSQYAFAAPSHCPNPNLPIPYHQYPPGFYPPQPVPIGPLPQNFHRYPCGGVPPMVAPLVEHQKTITIRNDVNVKKDSIRVEEDEENPGKFIVCFTFDAAAPGSITLEFFAKDDLDCNIVVTKENSLPPVTVSFDQGLGQTFRQPSGTGIGFSMFEESEIKKESDGVYPLMVKAETHSQGQPSNNDGLDGNSTASSQITFAAFDKKGNDKFVVRVMKQILWVNRTRYELQEIYGIGNSVEVESDGSDSGKECVICLSEPSDTTCLPCRHMCMCSSCSKVLRFQTDRCPICRQPFVYLVVIKVKNGADD